MRTRTSFAMACPSTSGVCSGRDGGEAGWHGYAAHAHVAMAHAMCQELVPPCMGMCCRAVGSYCQRHGTGAWVAPGGAGSRLHGPFRGCCCSKVRAQYLLRCPAQLDTHHQQQALRTQAGCNVHSPVLSTKGQHLNTPHPTHYPLPAPLMHFVNQVPRG